VQVVVPGCAGSFRCSDQRLEVLDVAQGAVGNCLLNPRQPCALQFSKVELSGLAKQRLDCSGPPQLQGKARGTEQPAATARGLAEFGRACHRSYGHGDRAALSRASSGGFEIDRDVFVFAGLQCRTVPRTSVGLICKHSRQCLMSTPTLLQRGALHDCGAHERMAKPKRLEIDLDDAGLGGRRHDVEVQVRSDYRAAGRDDLTQ
jgi:hypothetical protein